MYEYNTTFFDEFEKTSLMAATEILPEIIKRTKLASVVDFGCGEGVWLSVVSSIDKTIIMDPVSMKPDFGK